MASFPVALAIINPHSGTISAEQKNLLHNAFLQRAKALHFIPEIVQTQYPGHATEIATQAVKKGVTHVLAIGGDGTVNEVAKSLRRSATALGIVPIGSGNGLARHLGIPLNPVKAIERALRGRPVVIDSGEINEYPFFCTTGLGFEAYVAHAFAKEPRRGLPTYIQTTFREFRNYEPQRFRINGQEKELFSLTFANAGQYGNNAWIAPTANIADGRLEQCEIHPFPMQAAGILGWLLFNKRLNQSTYWRGYSIKETTITVDEPPLIHVDGEPVTLTTNRILIRVLPSSLLVLL